MQFWQRGISTPIAWMVGQCFGKCVMKSHSTMTCSIWASETIRSSSPNRICARHEHRGWVMHVYARWWTPWHLYCFPKWSHASSYNHALHLQSGSCLKRFVKVTQATLSCFCDEGFATEGFAAAISWSMDSKQVCWQPLLKWHFFGVPLCLCWCQQCSLQLEATWSCAKSAMLTMKCHLRTWIRMQQASQEGTYMAPFAFCFSFRTGLHCHPRWHGRSLLLPSWFAPERGTPILTELTSNSNWIGRALQ